MRGEKHKLAAQLASVSAIGPSTTRATSTDTLSSFEQRSYESYTLERYLLRKEPGSARVRVTEWKGTDVAGSEF